MHHSSMDRVTLPLALSRASADSSSLLTSARLASTKGSYTPLQMGPPAAATAAAEPRLDASADFDDGSAGPVGPAWHSYTLDDLLGPKAAAATVHYEEEAPGHSDAAGTSFHLASRRRHAQPSLAESAASHLLLDAHCAGPDALAKLCALPPPFLAAPVYSEAAASTIAAAAAPPGEFVGVTGVLDCALLLLRSLQKMKASSLPPGQDHAPLSVQSDAALLVDLSGASPFIPLDVSCHPGPRPIAALVSLFAQGAQRVCCLEGKDVRCDREKFRGLVTQQSVLAFLHAHRADWGELGARTAGELGLIAPVPAGQPCIEWGDTTVVSALQSWLQAPNPAMAPLPSLPLCHDGAFVDALSPADLRGVLSSRVRSEFYMSVFELKCRERARALQQREKEARRSGPAHRASRQLSFGGGSIGGSVAFMTELPSTASSRPGSGHNSRSSSRRSSINGDSTQSLAAAFATASASNSSGGGSGQKQPLRLPDTGVRIPLRKKSLEPSFGYEDEFARAVRLNASKPSSSSSSSALPRIRSAHGSREGSPERAHHHQAGPQSMSTAVATVLAARSALPTHSRRRTMPTQAFAAMFASNGSPAPPATRLAALPESSSSSSVTSPPQTASQLGRPTYSSSRRTTGDFGHGRLPSFGSAGALTAAAASIVSNDGSSSGSAHSTPSRRSTGTLSSTRLSALSNSSSAASVHHSPSAAVAVAAQPTELPVLGSRRGEGSVASIIRRRSIGGDDELSQLERRVSHGHGHGAATAADSALSTPRHAPSAAATAPASDSAVLSRRAKRATLPSSFFSSAAAAAAGAAPDASTDLSALMARLRQPAAQATGDSHAVTSPDRAETLSGSSAPALLPHHFSVSLMSAVNTGLTVAADTPFSVLVDRLARASVGCLWCVDAHGKVSGCVTATDIFRCLQQHAPRDTAAVAISQFGLHLD